MSDEMDGHKGAFVFYPKLHRPGQFKGQILVIPIKVLYDQGGAMYLSKSKIEGFLPLAECLASTLPMQSFATANFARISL